MSLSPVSQAATVRRHSGVLLLYGVLALGLTWPLARYFTTHVPGDGIDDPSLAWNLWWVKTRLIEQLNLDIFHSDWMFYPIQINLGFYTLTPLNGLLSVPLQAAFNLIIASNLILLLSFVLSGYGAFLLVRDLLRSSTLPSTLTPPLLPSLLAGLIYAFASSKLFYAGLGQFNIASSQWIPFCVLYLLRMGCSPNQRATIRNALLAALFLTFQAWSELTYASFLLIFIGLYFLWLLLIPKEFPTFSRQTWTHIIGSFVLLGVVFLVGIAPFLWAMLPDLRQEGDFFASGGGFADQFSADLMGYLVPTQLHPLVGDWVAGLPFAHDKGQQIYIGYTALAILIVGLVGLLRHPSAIVRRQGWFWALITGFFWLLTLGPHVRWAGQDLPIPGPFALISQLPFFSGNRYPSRYSVMLMLGVAVLAGYGVWRIGDWRLEIGDWKTRRRPNLQSPISNLLIAFLSLLFLFEHASFPLPINDSRVPAIYKTLAAAGAPSGKDSTVLELPTGWRNGARVLGKPDELIMMQQWYQTVHGKRRLGGNTSRNPTYKFQYFSEAPLLGDLIALMNADQAHIAALVDAELDQMIARDRLLAPAVLDFLDVQFVTVHVEKSPPALLRFVDEALPLTLIETWQGVDWKGASSTIRLYQVNALALVSDWTIDLADPMSKLYLAEGWSALAADGVRYATRRKAGLLLAIPNAGGKLTLTLVPPATGARVTLNGQLLPAAAVSDNQLTVAIAPGVASAPVDQVEIEFSNEPVSVTTLPAAPDPRGWPLGSSGAFLLGATSLVVQSAGNEAGDFAHIWINGQDMALSGGEPAYNVVALDAQGNLLDRAMFNTSAAGTASAALAAWLQQWPDNTVIAGAVADEASTNLGADAVQALARLGVSGDLRGKLRWGHAFIGVVGAAPGTALEAISLLQPATVFVGAPVDAAQVGGGVGTVQFENIR